MLPLWYRAMTHGVRCDYVPQHGSIGAAAHYAFGKLLAMSFQFVTAHFRVSDGIVSYHQEKNRDRCLGAVGVCRPVADMSWGEYEESETGKQYGVLLSKSREGTYLSQEICSSRQVDNGRPFVCGSFIVHLDDEGCLLPMSGHYQKQEDTEKPTFVFLTAMAFLHCKNVESIDDRSAEQPLKWHRRTRCPRVQFKTIKIPMATRGKSSEGEHRDDASPVALHMVRGHFATYTADKPLFGRPDGVGKFWHPAHIRGDGGAGIVVKDYTIGN